MTYRRTIRSLAAPLAIEPPAPPAYDLDALTVALFLDEIQRQMEIQQLGRERPLITIVVPKGTRVEPGLGRLCEGLDVAVCEEGNEPADGMVLRMSRGEERPPRRKM